MNFFRPYNSGLLLLLAMPFLTAVPTIDAMMGLYFVPLLVLDNILMRPFDYPRGAEFIKNTGFFILPVRVVLFTVLCFGLSVAGSQLGIGLRVWDWETPSRYSILALGLGGAVLAIGLRRYTRQRDDIFLSRSGVFGVFEAIDRYLSSRSDYQRSTSRSTPLTKPSTMVMVRPWVLNPPKNQNISETLRQYIGFIRSDDHRLRLAYVLIVASNGGNSYAQTALQLLIQQKGFVADYRDDEVMVRAKSALPAPD